MLRMLLIVACLFIQGCASTNQTNSVIVTGVGSSFEAAKENAFRHAVEQQIGVLIHSERETRGNNLVKDDILAYSAGYVDDFKILQTTMRNNQVQMRVEVWVSNSRIQNRILSKGISDSDVQGNRLQAQYNTFLREKETGDKLLLKLLAQYPQNAYVIETGEIEYRHDTNRDSLMVIPYKISWNKEFLQSMNETLAVLSDQPMFGRQSPKTITVKGKKKSDLIIGYTNKYHFNDTIRFDYLQRTIDNNSLRIRVTLKQNDRNLYSECWIPNEQLFGSGQYDISLEGNRVERGHIRLDIPKLSNLHNLMRQVNNIQLSIDEVYQCTNKR